MAHIEMGNLWCSLLTNNEQLIEIATEESSYEVEGWEYIKKNKLEKAKEEGNADKIKYWTDWEGRFGVHKEIFSSKGDLGVMFPTGLLDRILLRFQLEAENEKIAILDQTQAWDVHREEPSYNLSFIARDYQNDCIKYIKDKYITRGIIKAPTGSGKTIVGTMLIKENYVPTLIIVDKTVLIDQWKEALFQVLDIPEGDVGIAKGKTNFDPSYITIVTQQSLNSWWKNQTKPEGTHWHILMNLHGKGGWGQVIRDEVHHAGSEKGFEIMMQINAHLRWGFSATPDLRQDQNLKQIGCIGEIIYTIGSERLIAHEFLAQPKIRFLPTDRVIFDWHDKYRQVYKEGITYNTKRNRMVTHQAGLASKKGSVLVFVDFIEHGILLESMMQDVAPMYDTTAEFVSSKHEDRDGVFERFHSGETKILIATEGLIGEGYDYKAIETVIVANGGKGAIRTIQKMGRGMRVTEVKKSVDVIDFADRCKYLGSHAKSRAAIWREWGFEPDISDTPWLEG